jgi:hypothetical protein
VIALIKANHANPQTTLYLRRSLEIMSTIYKIHPAIGIARVGNSSDYYLGPETTVKSGQSSGGLPLEKDGKTPVTQFRDGNNCVRRQAARFRIYAYDDSTPNGSMIQPGVGGIKDILWMVHLANKKAAWYEFQQLDGSDGTYPYTHPLRNRHILGKDRNKLIIDPGPQTISCKGTNQTATSAEFTKGKGPKGYAQNFPPTGLVPEGSDITTLGSISADDSGYLYVLGGMGNSGVSAAYDITAQLLDEWCTEDKFPCSVIQKLRKIQNCGYKSPSDFSAAVQKALGDSDNDKYGTMIVSMAGPQPRIDTYANNDLWWDDTSDGPVTATLILDDGSRVDVCPAWVLVTPPSYAPQIQNMITLYDAIYDMVVHQEKTPLRPNGEWNQDYKPNFTSEIQPILKRPSAYQWVALINPPGIPSHNRLTAPDSEKYPPNFFGYLRKPEDKNTVTPTLMPQLAGDNPLTDSNPSKYLTLTETQFFLLQQYVAGKADDSTPADPLDTGAALTKAVLENCVGGPFCPGIEMTWICREPKIYMEPFRLKHKPLNSSGLNWDNNPADGEGLEPGDVLKYMALPWQADFNECATQVVDTTVLWWWPAQRPYYVYYQQKDGTWAQDYWTRPSADSFSVDELMVYNWKDLGFIVKQSGPSDTPDFAEMQRNELTMPDPHPSKYDNEYA